MRIAILDDYQGVALGLADWASLDAEIDVFSEHIGDPDELVRRLAGHEVVVAMRERTPFPAELLARLPELRLLVTTGPVNASIDVPAARQHDIAVCGTGYFSAPTAEHTWALILAVCRNLPMEAAGMRRGGWQQSLGRGVHGRTLGLLGLGRLGSAVARIGQAFGMTTMAWSQHLTPERAAEHGVTAVSKEELFAQADVLSVHLVLSPRTRGLVGAAELASMKSDAVLVNTSRGPIVQEQALIEALTRGTIAAAALDVFDVEPLPADHPLRALPNVVLTPHLGYVTRELYEVFFRDAVEDVHAYLRGEPVRLLT